MKFWVVMRDICKWGPGFYAEFRYTSRGIATWPAEPAKKTISLTSHMTIPLFQDQGPEMDSSAIIVIRKEL